MITRMLFGMLIVSLLPVWRLPGTKSDHGDGLTLWEYFKALSMNPPVYKHIPYSEAVNRARAEYLKTL